MERHASRTWALAAALALPGALAACKPPPEAPRRPVEIGAAVAVDPAATIATPPAPPADANVADPVFAGDRVATGPGGAIRVRFADATAFSMGANASMTIDSFVYDPNRDASSMSLDFKKGAFRFASGAPLHRDAGQAPVKTPVATIGIRGTAFTGVIGPEAEEAWQAIDTRYRADGGSVEQATLILLGEGAIDVRWSGKSALLDMPGQAIFFRRPGTDPLGPLLVTDWRRGQIEALASPPSLGPGRGAPPAAPTPTPSASASAAPAPSPSASPPRAPRPTPSASPSQTRPEPSATPSASPRPWPSARPTAPRPAPTVRPTYRPPTPRPTPTGRPTYRPGTDPRPTPSPTPRLSPRPTFRPPETGATPRPTLRPPVTRATTAPDPRPALRPRPGPTPTGQKRIG